MAYVLSLQPHSPLKRSFSDNPYLQSWSPLRDSLLSPLGDITSRNVSVASLYNLSSKGASERSFGNENVPPLTSQSLLNLVSVDQELEHAARHVHITPRKRTYDSKQCPPVVPQLSESSYRSSRRVQEKRHCNNADADPVLDDQSGAESMEGQKANFEESELFSLYEAIHMPLPNGRSSDNIESEAMGPNTYEGDAPVYDTQPFRRWVSTLRKRQFHRHKDQPSAQHGGSHETMPKCPENLLCPSTSPQRRASESMTSSMGCITAVKSASITIASTSFVPHSDGALPSKPRMANRSSNFSDARRSLDSHHGSLGPVIDESAWLRSLQRRKVVEELIASEESYIADLKVLINDYFMILTALPSLSNQTKSSIQHNISQILQLHEDLLAELHQVIPQADFTKSAHQEAYPVTKAKHIRFHSADILPGRMIEVKGVRKLRHSLEIGRSPDRRPRGLVTDTKTVGNIAKVFNTHMKRFFTYEEYGAHWTTMSHDLTIMCKGLHGWQEYERGVEALQTVIASENNRESGSKKALSFPDLLIKPIQRVCKYPLLFEDLCRQTPVCDDPEAHAELEKALFRLQETIREVNKAKDDPRTRRLIEITWQLQDRLVFQEQTISRALVFRILGHVLLCGVLHVTYQSSERIKGQYMICILYKSCLVLATTGRFHTPFTVVASINLANGTVEDCANGRGIQCHTAPHTWKLLFEHKHRLHEIVLSACSSQEEEVWKKHLRERILSETQDFVEGQSNMQDMFSPFTLDIKSLGPVFGHTDSLVRRMSVHRAATLGAKTNMSQIIIKNTQAQKLPESPPMFLPSTIARSQSHMSSNHIPTLAPRRAERIRLETVLEDIWTKDALPFPGMSNRRVENQIRASANSVMRKLSMASIASNFSRRSPSFSSMSNTRSEESFGSRVHKMSQNNLKARPVTNRCPAPAVVDFHNAPAAFLPMDFELQGTRPASRRRRLANRTGEPQRRSDRSTNVKPRRVRRLSTHLVSLPRSESSARVEVRNVSHCSDSTVVRTSDNSAGTSQRCETERQKRKEERDSGSRGESLGMPPSKKFFKSKSRIFKFWV